MPVTVSCIWFWNTLNTDQHACQSQLYLGREHPKHRPVCLSLSAVPWWGTPHTQTSIPVTLSCTLVGNTLNTDQHACQSQLYLGREHPKHRPVCLSLSAVPWWGTPYTQTSIPVTLSCTLVGNTLNTDQYVCHSQLYLVLEHPKHRPACLSLSCTLVGNTRNTDQYACHCQLCLIEEHPKHKLVCLTLSAIPGWGTP